MKEMAVQVGHLCSEQSRLTGQSRDGRRAGKMATANVVAGEILEETAASVSDFLLLSHDHLGMSSPHTCQVN